MASGMTSRPSDDIDLLPASPLDRIQWKAAAVAETVDRRSSTPPRPGRS
jgi:hypothetical protein